MTKIVWLGLLFFGLLSCSNNKGAKPEGDSVRLGADTVATESSDSAKARGDRTLDAIRESVNEIPTDSFSIDTAH